MKIKWNGHASFTVTAGDGTVIITDPYEPGGFGGAIKYGPIKDKADGVLVSHEHADHNYTKGLAGSPKILKGSGKIKSVEIKGINTFHDESSGKERGANTVFVFSVDGIRICFMGDQGHQLSKEQISAIGPVDLLLVPVGGFYTIDAGGAAKMVDALKPRLVIPMHYKTEKVDFPIAEVDKFLSQMIKVKKLDHSEVEIKAQDLPPSGPEVWVIQFAC